MAVEKPNLDQLSLKTTLAADDARSAGVEISRNDFIDMTDGMVSSKDLAIADGWVGVLEGYLDESSFTHKLTKLGLTKLPKDLAREKATEMLAAAKGLQAAVSAQLEAEKELKPSAWAWEEAKDEFRTPIHFARTVRNFFRSDDSK